MSSVKARASSPGKSPVRSSRGGAAHLLGIRHHGPGSARSLVNALTALQPQCVLIEGPPEANGIVTLAAHQELTPPVALLIYSTEGRQESGEGAAGGSLYPFAPFSPEWQAIRFALEHCVPVRFIDLPTGVSSKEPAQERPATPDPLSEMARAAGYSDTERWWDQLVESRSGGDLELFAALHEMITALRTELDGQPYYPAGPAGPAGAAGPTTGPAGAPLRERLREAHMRSCIRAAEQEGFERIAVVCGAYHTPALAAAVPAAEDEALLGAAQTAVKGLPMQAAWVPWSYERLAASTGYGAGIESPLWYELLWQRRASVGPAWITRAARLLREADVPISSAHVIETCRLADTLSCLRGRPIPGLPEFQDAAVSVLGQGDAQNLNIIHSRWHFDGRLGVVPADFPSAPLQRDLAALQKRLRLKPELTPRALELDLRQALDRERSLVLRRLRILGVTWGEEARARRGQKGSFHEDWELCWEPAMMIRLIESSSLGHTLGEAAAGALIEKAGTARELRTLIALLDDALLADLPAGLAALVAAIQEETAASCDVPQLLAAIPPLVDVQRYGNVRGSDTGLVAQILAGLVPRALIGLPMACAGIDDDAAHALWQALLAAGQSLSRLADSGHLAAWHETLKRLGNSVAVHPLLGGSAQRLLYDAQAIALTELAQAMSLALSQASPPAQAASWIEGLLSGGAELLIHDDALRQLLAGWVRGISHEHFVQSLPLLRRTFAQTPATLRRTLGERLTAGPGSPAAAPGIATGIDAVAAAAVLPVLALIWSHDTPKDPA